MAPAPGRRGLHITNRCEEQGVLHYWVADPESRQLLAWSLTDGRYGEPRVCEDGRPLTVTAPFEVALSTKAIFG